MKLWQFCSCCPFCMHCTTFSSGAAHVAFSINWSLGSESLYRPSLSHRKRSLSAPRYFYLNRRLPGADENLIPGHIEEHLRVRRDAGLMELIEC